MISPRALVEHYFGATLFLFSALGLVLPFIDRTPPNAVLGLLALVIFLSAFKMELAELRTIRVGELVFFFVARYLVLPCALYFVAPRFALGILMLALVPPGVSSPAFCALMRGNVALALALVVVTTVLCPFYIPALLAICAGHGVHIDLAALFVSLVACVLAPLLLHVPLRRIAPVRSWIDRNGNFLAVLLIAMTFGLVLAKRRDFLFAHLASLPLPFALSAASYGIFYGLGWALGPRARRPDRVTFALCSGANNVVLAVSLALLYLPEETSVFLVLAEVPWVLTIVPFRRLSRA